MRIARLGPFARRFLERHSMARVSAVFARSFHLEAGDDALCVVDPTLGDGALNAVLDTSFDASAAPHVDAPADISEGSIALRGRNILRFDKASDWRPSWSALPCGRDPLPADLLREALARAPREGAFRPALDPRFFPVTSLQQALAERTRTLETWLAGRVDFWKSGFPPIEGLIGLGEGLTPSGDDFVGGAMIALREFDHPPLAERLAGFAVSVSENATTILSRAMLSAAADGYGAAALHDLIVAIGDGDAPRAIEMLDAIDRIGHTSGWDALAGALVAIRALNG